jgi:hypothetical protein
MCKELVVNRLLLSSTSPDLGAITTGILSKGGGWDDDDRDWRETTPEDAT